MFDVVAAFFIYTLSNIAWYDVEVNKLETVALYSNKVNIEPWNQHFGLKFLPSRHLSCYVSSYVEWGIVLIQFSTSCSLL